MIKVTGRRWIWIAFASASIIKLIKDIPAFIEKNINPVHVSTNLMGEIPSLMISGLVLVGVFWVYSLFKSINKSEAALEENNSFLNLIFLGMPDSLMLIDSNYKILSVNSQFETDYTNNRDDLTGKYCYQLTHGRTKPCDDTDHPCPMDTVFKQGIPAVLEHIHKDHDGNDIYLELSCFPIRDSEGNVTSMVELAHNITDRKLAENRIIKERDKAQMYLDVAEVIIIIYDSEGIIVQINKKGCDLLEYSESELIGENWFDTVLLTEHRSTIKSKFAKIVSGEISHNKYYENTILTKSGKVLMVSWHSNMLYNEEGKINGAISSGIDITVQIRMKDRIRTLSQAVEQSPSITIITDIEGDIEYVNPKFTEITGYLPGEVIGSNPRILKSGDFSREDYTSLWKAITSGKEWRGEFHNKKKNG
ncbi:MAG: PAS domain S-box protein, partial [Spirochaetaceae bacterium]|nr:PAS domain S-box protein [Spirochaetaceae bacterium]